MYEFRAELTDSRTIKITSNTYWSCRAEGNFKLSNYNGENDDIIKIEIPNDIMFADGTVYFSYGDERCEYPELSIYASNNCYIRTYPDYIDCEDNRTINFYYESSRQLFTASIFCFNGWKVDRSDFPYILNTNEITVKSTGTDGELVISQNGDCENKNILYIKLIKQEEYVPPTPPVVIDVTGVEISPKSVRLQINKTKQLYVTVLPINATNKNVTWYSSDNSVATVNSNGLVTTHSIGECTITVKTIDGGYTDTCTITVSDSPSPGENNYLTFVAIERTRFEYAIQNAISYSLDDGETWSVLGGGYTPYIDTGEKIMWKGRLSTSSTGIGKFSSSNKFAVEGNIMSLLYGDDFADKISLYNKSYAFYGLFALCENLISAENLLLPATTLSPYCYYYMFQDCKSLTTAPTLPATTLATYCYGGMFQGCTSLTTSPTLPATTLATYCYYYMFQDCTSLTTAPTLPATTLESGCYYRMFEGCINLITAPSLPATTLASSCYTAMFSGCKNLTVPPVLRAGTLAPNCYSNMFRDCIKLTTAPELQAETMYEFCYSSMFNGCSGLTTAPELHATELKDGCYSRMFYGCSSLSAITCLATDIAAIGCTQRWVDGVSESGTFKKAENMASWPSGVDGIPVNWNVEEE